VIGAALSTGGYTINLGLILASHRAATGMDALTDSVKLSYKTKLRFDY
jgi:hypothetical protein